MKLLQQQPEYAHIFWHRQKVQFGPAQQRERIADRINKPFRRDRRSGAQCPTQQIENLVMPAPRWMQKNVKLLRQCRQLFHGEFVQRIQVDRGRPAPFLIRSRYTLGRG